VQPPFTGAKNMDQDRAIATPATIHATLVALSQQAQAEKFYGTSVVFQLMASDPRLETDAAARNEFAIRLVALYLHLPLDSGERDLVRSAQSALCESTRPLA
jgi:hypothetical protein